MLDNDVNKMKQQQIAFQTMQTNPQSQVAMQSVSPELLKENVQDSYVANRVADTTDDPKAMLATAGLMIPTWLLITQSMDKFAEKSRGSYEGTIQHKIGDFGDRVANSSFMKSGFMTSVGNGFKSFGNFIKTKILDKTRITRAFMNTPSRPENPMAYQQWRGMEGVQQIDYPNFKDCFLKARKHPSDLDCYGATKQEVANYTSRWNAATTPADKAKVIEEAEKELLIKYAKPDRITDARRLAIDWASATPQRRIEILKDLKALNLGYKDFKHLENLNTQAHLNIAEIYEANHNANPKMFSRNLGSNKNGLTQFETKILGREVYASEYNNKWVAEFQHVDLNSTDPYNVRIRKSLENTGDINHFAKTKFGRLLNYYTHLITEGATNRVAGGKLVALMQAWFLAEAIYKAGKAEGGMSEKGKVFAERFTELVAMLACLPLSLQLMHRIGGLQYAGMTKNQVEAFRAKLKAHNEKSMSGGYSTKAEWAKIDKELKNELNAGVKNPFVKLAKRIGRIVTVGLEQRRPWDKNSIAVMKDGQPTFRKGIMAKLKDLWHHPKFGLKQMAGYPMRIGIGMMVIFPFVSKLAVKGCHMIFGKPQHSLLDEDKEQEMAEKKAEELSKTQLPPQLQNSPQLQQNPQQIVQQQETVQQVQTNQQMYQSPTNLLNRYKTPYSTTTTTTTTTTVNPQIPTEPVRTYIPSPVGVKLNNMEDLTPADEAMKRADIAEQQALETLKMN